MYYGGRQAITRLRQMAKQRGIDVDAIQESQKAAAKKIRADRKSAKAKAKTGGRPAARRARPAAQTAQPAEDVKALATTTDANEPAEATTTETDQ